MAVNVVDFSPEGDYFSYTSPDGCLKIWDTSSNTLKQEYTPSSHLSATCTSMAWCPYKHNAGAYSSTKRVKKAKLNCVDNAVSDLKLIALGTLSGEVLLYSVTKGDLHTKMTGGHNDAITGVAWLFEEDSIFTCSKDQHVVRWSISKGTVITKWKVGKTAVNSISVVDKNNLLTASSAIFWWDIKTQTLIKKFTGHATEVFRLIPINVVKNSQQLKYFVSSAVNDRVVNIWQLDDSRECKAIASFALSEEPAWLDIPKNVDQQPLILSVVTKSGDLQIFQHQLNGRIMKPLLPVQTLHIASMAKGEDKSKSIPILSSKFLGGSPAAFTLTYGNFLNPVFETMELSLSEKETFIVRELRPFADITLEGVSKIKEPERPNDAKLLAPGYMMPLKPTENVSRKKKRKQTASKELPMEERLNAMYLGQATEEVETQPEAPTSNSMVHLLLQGLQSNDNALLNTVLTRSDDDLIRNTVKRLPLNSIPLLIKELHRRLTKKEQANRPCLRWLKGVFSIHLSYLMSVQEIDEYIGPLSQLIEAREATFSKMCQLKGFLDIYWSQVDLKTDDITSITTEALVEYEDSSSSEEDSEEEDGEMDHDEHLENLLHLDSQSSDESEDDVPLKSSEDEMDL